jgi:hypothetical protein
MGSAVKERENEFRNLFNLFSIHRKKNKSKQIARGLRKYEILLGGRIDYFRAIFMLTTWSGSQPTLK